MRLSNHCLRQDRGLKLEMGNFALLVSVEAQHWEDSGR
jgi:hypothetical protein